MLKAIHLRSNNSFKKFDEKNTKSLKKLSKYSLHNNNGEGISISEIKEFYPEYCALAGAIGVDNAAEFVRDILFFLQHRGEEGTGIVSSYREILYNHRGPGLVDQNFPRNYDFSQLPGTIAIGHNRYPTKGKVDKSSNIQPFIFEESRFGPFAIAHNGQLVDNNNLKQKFKDQGTPFQSNSDSELLAHLILKAPSRYKTIEDAIKSEITKIPTAYSLLIMTPHKVIALRDKFGVRPLSFGIQKEGGFLVSSETGVFNIYEELGQANLEREIKPGEMVIFDKNKIHNSDNIESIIFSEPDMKTCIFEGIYFMDPRSKINGVINEDFRQKLGEIVYQENKRFFDKIRKENKDNIAIVPVLNSGKQGAFGLSKISKIPYKEYIMRRQNRPQSYGRSFILSEETQREITIYMKQDIRTDKVKGKVLVVVDDSIVRGNTATILCERLINAGAKKIYYVSLSPKLVDICGLGMDIQNLNDLIAYKLKDESSIARMIKANKVFYLSNDGLHKAVKETYNIPICDGCYGGNHPIPINNQSSSS